MTDPKDAAIVKFAHADSDDAAAGMDFIGRFATDPPVVIRNLIDAARPLATAGARICELGFGSPGWLLDELRSAYPACRLYGLDMSEPFVRAASARFRRDVAITSGDMDRLPFRDGAFDAVYSCWTLYFMDDIDATLAEIRRTIRAGGRFIAATNTADHIIEYMDMAAEAMRRALGREPEPDIGLRFHTENGLAYMRRHFADVTLMPHEGEMVFRQPQDVLELWYWYGEAGLPEGERERVKAEFARLAEGHISLHGELRVRRRGGTFIATR